MEERSSKVIWLKRLQRSSIPIRIEAITTAIPKDERDLEQGSYVYVIGYKFTKILVEESPLQIYEKMVKAENRAKE